MSVGLLSLGPLRGLVGGGEVYLGVCLNGLVNGGSVGEVQDFKDILLEGGGSGGFYWEAFDSGLFQGSFWGLFWEPF